MSMMMSPRLRGLNTRMRRTGSSAERATGSKSFATGCKAASSICTIKRLFPVTFLNSAAAAPSEFTSTQSTPAFCWRIRNSAGEGCAGAGAPTLSFWLSGRLLTVSVRSQKE